MYIYILKKECRDVQCSSMPYPSKTDRETILATAMDQVSRYGIQKLAIRSVAAALGLAPNALYRYFANLAALKDALAEESRRLVLEALRKAAEKSPRRDGSKRCASLCAVCARTTQDIRSHADAVYYRGGRRCSACAVMAFCSGHVTASTGEERAPEAAVALWAVSTGMTALEAAVVFGESKPASSFEFGLRMWIKAASAKD